MGQIQTSSARLTSKFRSRKFLIAASSFVAVTVMAWFGCWHLAGDAGDIALIIGAWAASDAAILKLYNDANLKAEVE